MKCYFREHDETWTKGTIITLDGGARIVFEHEDAKKGYVTDASLLHPSFQIWEGGMSVCGYERVEDRNLYTLRFFTVRFSPPRKET